MLARLLRPWFVLTLVAVATACYASSCRDDEVIEPKAPPAGPAFPGESRLAKKGGYDLVGAENKRHKRGESGRR